MSDYLDRFSGVGRLFGTRSLERLREAHVCVIGIGGVGSWSVEALARSGVGEITLIDLDDVCVTNVNRQLHALDGQIGRSKVAATAERARLIHPEGNIRAVEAFFTAGNADDLLSPGYDYIIDAIDSIDPKCLLIDECRKRGLRIVTAGGAGGKRDPSGVRTSDLAFATNDRLLKQVRKKLRREFGYPRDERQPFGLTAVFSVENAVYPWADGSVCERPEPGSALALNCDSGFGTASFVTGAFGFAAAAVAVRHLAEE